MIEHESDTNIDYLSNIYMDGEKYYWVLYTSSRYHFDDIGYTSEIDAKSALDNKIGELNEM
jgi:hypothetical protein